MRLKSAAILSASLLALTAAPAAHAASFFFNLSAGTSIGATFGNVNQYSTTVGGTTVNMQASAWRVSSGTIRNAYLGTFSAGLGVTNRSEDGDNGTHTVDNHSGTDFIIFQFDKSVELLSGKFTTFELFNFNYEDSDATIDYGTNSSAWNSTLALNNQNLSAVNSLMNGVEFEATGGAAPFNTGGVVRSLQPGAPGQKVGNIWMVAASFINQDGKKDSFKFDDLTVSYIDPLPEPGSWALMLAGFGMVGFSLRRRKALAAA